VIGIYEGLLVIVLKGDLHCGIQLFKGRFHFVLVAKFPGFVKMIFYIIAGSSVFLGKGMAIA
jgi:hypothetical protein